MGSGKSSLISALLGEMKTVSGTVNTQGIKTRIVFGGEFQFHGKIVSFVFFI